MRRKAWSLLLFGIIVIVSGCASKSSGPVAGSESATWLDGSEKDLKQFVAHPGNTIVGLKPRRLSNLIRLLDSMPHEAAYAAMITETSDTEAFAEMVIVKLPSDETARAKFVSSVKEFFTSRGYPAECAAVDPKDPRFLLIEGNPQGSVFSIPTTDDP